MRTRLASKHASPPKEQALKHPAPFSATTRFTRRILIDSHSPIQVAMDGYLRSAAGSHQTQFRFGNLLS